MHIISYSNVLINLTDGFGEKGKPASGGEAAVPPNATLEIELELVSWKTVSEVTDDNKVIKKILKEGEGYERPNDGAVVKGLLSQILSVCVSSPVTVTYKCFICYFLAVKLIGKLGDGTVFLKKGHGEGEELFEFKTDEGNYGFENFLLINLMFWTSSF